MQRHPLKLVLGRPALHLLLALVFAFAFFWPIFVMTRPAQTFHFSYASWIASLIVLFAVSRAIPIDSPDVLEEADGGADDKIRETF
jgi:CDP-diglyceride synthetase